MTSTHYLRQHKSWFRSQWHLLKLKHKKIKVASLRAIAWQSAGWAQPVVRLQFTSM